MEKISVNLEDYKAVVNLLCRLSACLASGDDDFSLLTDEFEYERVYNLLMSI